MKQETVYDTKLESDLTITIGGNAEENWKIIDAANQNDLWFHLEDHPSAHVILAMPDGKTSKDLNKQTLIHCAVICKQHSKFPTISNQNKMSVIYTETKNVTKADKEGAVYTKKTKTISV